MTIAESPTPNGYQGVCTAPGKAASELAVTSPGDMRTWYFVWTQVPEDAAYVTFTRSQDEVKQVPVDGVSYITLTGAPAEIADDPPVATAFDTSGTKLGEARVPEWQIDLGKRL